MVLGIPSSRYLLVGVAVLPLVAAEPLVVLRGNETWQNEAAGNIRSPFWDLRLSDADAEPGLPIPAGHALVTATARTRTIYWPNGGLIAQPPSVPVRPGLAVATEDRREYELRYRQGLATPWVWDAEVELRVPAAQRTTRVNSSVAGDYDLDAVGDASVLFKVPMWQERYAGVLAGIGATLPTGNTKDWVSASGGYGLLGNLAWSGLVPGVDYLSFRVFGEGHLVEQAHYELFTDVLNRSPELTGSLQHARVGWSLAWAASTSWSVGFGSYGEAWKFHDLTTKSTSIRHGNDEIVTSSTDVWTRWMAIPGQGFVSLGLGYENWTNGNSERHPMNVTLKLEALPW